MNKKICILNVRERCLSVINKIVPTTKIDEKVNGWIDELDLIEIVMEAELEFNCKIEEGNVSISEFNKISDLVDWLVLKIN